jgi:hypothetical protein
VGRASQDPPELRERAVRMVAGSKPIRATVLANAFDMERHRDVRLLRAERAPPLSRPAIS